MDCMEVCPVDCFYEGEITLRSSTVVGSRGPTSWIYFFSKIFSGKAVFGKKIAPHNGNIAIFLGKFSVLILTKF